jgi:uncharacterized protein (DUF1501 family)
MISRRTFLRTATASMAAFLAPGGLLRARPARAAGTDPVLVAVYLRGGADALSLVVPHGDPIYYTARPNIRVAPGTHHDLDGFFGLHPTMGALMPYFQSGRLSVLHACGSPDGTRSHFDAQDFMEYAAPGDKTVQVGWLNRFLQVAGLSTPISAVTIEGQKAKALAGPAESLAIPGLDKFVLSGTYTQERRGALETIFATTSQSMVGAMGHNALELIDLIAGLNTSTPVVYPTTKLGAALRDLSVLIRSDVGVRVAAVNLAAWDHHANQTTYFPIMAGDLAGSLAAFAQDLGSDLDRVVVLVMSEFGRRLAENGARGSDHGHGGVMFALGGAVEGGSVRLANDTWPGLTPPQLFQTIDLAATTDFRNVFAEVLDRHMGLSDPSPVFPNFPVSESNYPGLFG